MNGNEPSVKKNRIASEYERIQLQIRNEESITSQQNFHELPNKLSNGISSKDAMSPL